jgi:hypothetical protein
MPIRPYRPTQHQPINQPSLNSMLYPKGSKQPVQVWGSVMNVYKAPETTPQPTPSPTGTANPTPTPTITPTGTAAVTPTPSVTQTQTNTPTPSGTPSVTPTQTNTPSVTPTFTQTPTNTTTPTTTPTPSPVVLLLDTYPALIAYSTRKLRTAYSGSAMRVRRETDNVEQDIGFVSNELDTASLTSFLGSTTGSVVKWYNQGTGGTTSDMIQTSAGSQPKATTSGGVVYTAGTTNKPVVFFNGGNVMSPSPELQFGGGNNVTVFIVSQRTGGGTGQAIVAEGTGNYRVNFYQNQCQFDTGGSNVVGSYSGVFSALTQGTFVRGNANKAFIKKIQSGSTNNTTAPNITGIRLSLGNRTGSDLPLTGYIAEVIIFTSNQESNLTAISDNQINYYGA